jgi:1-acyl-sn-glycerol-3-phosphate acyltransferase
MFYKVVRFLAGLFIRIKFRVTIVGLEHVPKKGPVIIAANHTSNYDPILLCTILTRKAHFMAKHELFLHPVTRWFFTKLHAIPVNRSGVVISAVRRSLQVINSGEVFGIFPEGTRCKNGERVKPKKGVAFLGLKTNAPIVPIALIGVQKGWRPSVTVMVGAPVYPHDSGIKEYVALSHSIMNRIRSLALESLSLTPSKGRLFRRKTV